MRYLDLKVSTLQNIYLRNGIAVWIISVIMDLIELAGKLLLRLPTVVCSLYCTCKQCSYLAIGPIGQNALVAPSPEKKILYVL